MNLRKFTSPFAVVFFITLLSLDELMTANAQQGMVSHCGHDCVFEVAAKQDLGNDRTTKFSSAARNWLKGRKLGANNVEKKDGETSPTSSVKKGVAPAEKLNVMLSNRDTHSRTKLVDLIPLSCDYKGPKTHPPKNN